MATVIATLFIIAGAAAGLTVGIRRWIAENRNPSLRQAREARQLARRGHDQTIVTRYQRGGTAFHVIMTICTAGVWLIVWPLFFRRKRVTRIRYR